jgi:hypothetical protein
MPYSRHVAALLAMLTLTVAFGPMLLAANQSLDERLFPPPMETLYANRLQAESAKYLSINLFNVPIDHAQAARADNFIITSKDDADYAPDRQVHPVASGSRTRAIRVSLRKELLVKGTNIFLQLPTPMKNGNHYAVKVLDLGGAIPELSPILFDDSRQINDNIRLNQLGYLPEYAKYAYIGQYMGDAGPMPFDAAEFYLVDNHGARVFTGKIKPRHVGDELVGQHVYELNFTEFRTPGTYRIQVPGVGMSYDFEIGPGALTPLFTNLMRGNYHQRCGQEIDAAFSRHPRPACHLDDAYLDKSAEQTSFVEPKNPPLYPTNYDGKRHPAIHGHHDAGDYGKYTITGAGYVFDVLNAMSAFPGKFLSDNTGLPYSGNGIPDVLEECKWELDWLENMQDEDGGVFGVIRPNNGAYEQSMPQPEAHRLFFPKDTVFTAAYAAALAHASRSPEMRKYYPKDCDRYLARATRAWDWLAAHDRYVHYFHYGEVFGDWDERCWAAVEMYAATGQQKYHDYFLKNFDPSRKRWDWWPLFESVGYAVHAYLNLPDNRPHDNAMYQRCADALKEACEMHVSSAEAFPYRLSFPEASIHARTYGWFFPGDFSGYDLLMGYAHFKDKRYLQCVIDNLSYTCGANASSYFLQTGLGQKRNIEVVSDYNNNDGVIAPVPGLPLGIGTPGFYWIAKYGKQIGDGTYPQEWPLLNRWYDGFNVTSEFTMSPLMRETLVAGYFADVSPTAKRPTVKLIADRTSGATPLAVQFNIETSAQVREVFWDFGDESFSTRRAPQHVFNEAGKEYPIGVSIVDANGMFAYATTVISCDLGKVNFPRVQSKADSKTVVLYHLNGDLKDAAGHAPALKVITGKSDRTAYHFASRAPTWMSKPAGSCLELNGAEHFSVVLPGTLLPNPATTPVTVEMMLYLQEFDGWGYPGNPILLGLQNDWNSRLAWVQETWNKEQVPQFGSIAPAQFVSGFPRDRWCQVKLVYDGKGTASFYVDGKLWGSTQDQTFRPTVNHPLTLSFGPFKGMVDEVRVQLGAN